ncbi:MAG: tyrosine-protein phosphatase [Bacilli bacterium]|nr:tyrosine-protein phosphatase [Bacilli bacterium]
MANSQTKQGGMQGNVIMETAEPTIELTFPAKGQEVTIVKPAVLNYMMAMKEQAKGIENDYIFNDLNGDKVKIADYYRPSYHDDRAKKIPLVFDALGFAEGTTYQVKLSTNENMDGAEVYETTSPYVTVENLYANQTYYWQVSSGDVQSEISSFKTDCNVRMITADYVSNIRDMGGHLVKGGKRIKQGLIFRGGEIVYETYKDSKNGDTHSKTLSDEAIDVMLNEMKIGMEVDFRGATEANNITESDLKTYGHGDVSYYRYSIGGYGSAITSNSHFAELKQLFLDFGNAENRHVYFHCWGGADRTGTIGFLLGGLLGMSYTDLVIDYETTSFARNFRPHDSKGAYWDFPGLISTLKNTTGYYEGMEISEVIKNWLINSLGLSEEQVETIKANLLED